MILALRLSVLSLLMMSSSPLAPITNPGFPAVLVMVSVPLPAFIRPFKVRPLVPSAVVVAPPV